MFLKALHQDPSSSLSGEYRVRFFDRADPADREALDGLIREGGVASCCDTLADQLRELLALREPKRDLAPAELEARLTAHLAGRPLPDYGLWVYYPWSRSLVHLLPPAEFREVRGDRNRYKILPEEQERLRRCTIGIVGLSVGQATAVTMALEGVGGSFRLADFDTLGLSNLNRLRARVHDLGLNKAVLAARQILEVDPYLDIALFPEGVSEENLDAFLVGGGKLDLLVEECDDLFVKVRVRERCRDHGIPVLMETSERGMLDVERFDREPDRPLFRGRLGPIAAHELRGLSDVEKLAVILRILDAGELSAAGAASLLEVKETLSTWPQLASAVTLGGAVATDVARRLLLGSFTRSGRFYVDLDSLIAEGSADPRAVPEEPGISPEAALAPRAIPLPPRAPCGPPSREEVRFLVRHAILAPSGGNAQPWRFHWKRECLLVYADPSRSARLLDFEQGATHLALGAAVENIDLAGRALGLRTHFRPFPEPGEPLLACSLTFARAAGDVAPPRLLEQVPLRVTNRRTGERMPLDGDALEELLEAVDDPSVRLTLLTEPDQLVTLGEVLAEGDRLRFLSEGLHRELVEELRWTPGQVEATRDGVDVATLELSAADRAAFPLIASAQAMAHLRRIGGGRRLGELTRKAVASAGAVGVVTVHGSGPREYFRAGRAVQRIWLTATGRRLALQPMTALLYLFARLERGRGEGFTEEEQDGLRALRRRYAERVPIPEGHQDVFLFRVFKAGEPAARSLRRRLEEVLSFEG